MRTSVSPRLVGGALTLLLLADAKAVAHLNRPRPTCAQGALPPVSTLQVTARLATPALRPGQSLSGAATLTNFGHSPVTVVGVTAVLREPAAARPATWAQQPDPQIVVLAPGEYVTVPFHVHVSRCPGAGDLVPGFYELVLLISLPDGGVRRSTATSVVVSP